MYINIMNSLTEDQKIEEIDEFDELVKEEVHWIIKLINFFKRLCCL